MSSCGESWNAYSQMVINSLAVLYKIPQDRMHNLDEENYCS